MVFHFNKKHLEDPAIPMWVIKAKGESYYVEHVDCMVNWSTKETPDNSHTKGSIKIKDCLLANCLRCRLGNGFRSWDKFRHYRVCF